MNQHKNTINRTINIFYILILVAAVFSTVSCTFAKVPLPKPSNVRVENVTSNSATLLWDDIQGASGYDIELKSASSPYILLLSAYKSPYVLTNLDWDETYKVTIQPKAIGTVWDIWSDGPVSEITFKTKIPSYPEGELDHPLNTKAVLTDEEDVILTWDEVKDAVFYEIIRKFYYYDNRAEEKRIMTEGSEHSFTDNECKLIGSLYKVEYTICALNEELSNERHWSKPAVCLIEH